MLVLCAWPLAPWPAGFLPEALDVLASSLEHPYCLLGVEPQEVLPALPGSSLLTLFFSGLIPHLLGDVVFLWGCNLLAHFINAYLVDDSVSDSPGGLGNDQNPGSQVCWNKDLSIFSVYL